MPVLLRPLLLLVALGLPPLAVSEVSDAAAGGFTVTHRVTVEASRFRVYDALVNDVGQWWSSDHTVSGDAANLYLEPRPQGCFCERLGDDGAGLVHLSVTFVNPGVMLRLSGGLGPLGLMGASGNMTFEFDAGASETQSVLTMRYAVGGYRPGGLDAVAPAVDQVLGEQLERLREHVEQS